MLNFASTLEQYYLSDHQVLQDFALAHRISFLDGAIGTLVDSIIHHLLHAKCFSSAFPGLACTNTRAAFATTRELVSQVTTIILDKSGHIDYLKCVCRIIGMTDVEISVSETVDDCKRLIEIWKSDFTHCQNVEDILVRCEDLRPSELLLTCRKHNIVTEDSSKGNLELMRTRLVNHLCRSESDAPHETSSIPNCCSKSRQEALQLVQDVLKDLCKRKNVKKTLKRVLRSLGIAVSQSDDIAHVKKLALEYLKKAKRTPSTPKPNRMARLRNASLSDKRKALLDIRQSWPTKIGSRTKAKLIKKFLQRTSNKEIRRLPCAICAEAKTASQLAEKPFFLSELDIDVLRRPYPLHMQNPFQNTVLEDYILCPEGVENADSDNPSLRVCRSCATSLKSGKKLPALSLANNLVVGPVPDCLRDLTLVEEAMIALRRGKCCLIHLNGDSNLLGSPISQRGLRGHVIIYPTKIHCMTNILPPPMDDIVTPMCVVFVGSSQPSKEWLLTKARPLVVRREKVRAALIWLKDNNPLYKDVCINHELLDSFDHTFVAPIHITLREADDDVNAEGSNPAGLQPSSELPEGLELAFDSAVITDLEGRVVTPVQMQVEALRHLKSGGGFVQIPHGPEPSNTYNDHDAFPALFPTLFPYGTNGFEREDQPRKISMKIHAKHLLSLSDTRFQEHATFQFMVFNTLQRRDVNSSARFKINKNQFQFFQHGIDGISLHAIDCIASRLENGGSLEARTEDERVIMQLMNKVTAITGNVQGTSSSRVRVRNKIRAMMHFLGMPSFYITINPADVYSPILKFMSGQEIDLDNLLPEQVPQYWDQATRIARNPVLSAEFFDLSMQGFFDSILNYTADHNPDELGVLGLTKGYFGCVEAQGRGTLHCHLFVWLEGGLNPQQIKERVTDHEFTDRLCDYIDDNIKTAIPPLPTLDNVYPLQTFHPCATRGPFIDDEESFFDSPAAQTDLHLLANSCQRHVHAATCYKYWKGLHEKKECRFNLDPTQFVEKTTLDAESGEFEFRITDGMVNNFCDTILMAMRCNIDIKFIGSGQSAKAVLYYITDYITKAQLKAHNSYAALKTAVIKLRALDEDEDHDGYDYKARQLLVKCANSLISKQELSAPQVSAYLMGIGDHYTSHSFRTLFLFAFEAFVKDHLPRCLQSTPATRDERIGDETEDDDEDPSDSDSTVPNDDNVEQADEPSYDDVLIAAAPDGKVRAVQNDVTDYLLRSHSDDTLPLWNFISMYDKIPLAHDRRKITDPDKPARGRPCNPRAQFLPSHPDHDSHILRQRCADNYYIPVLTCAVPNSDIVANKERHAMLMLILFKPWRNVDDLLNGHSSWVDAYTSFQSDPDPERSRIIENMQLLNQCKDARDKDFAAKGANRRHLLRSLDASRGQRRAIDRGLDTFLEEDEEIAERLNDINRSQSNTLMTEKLEEESALAAARDAGLYDIDDEEYMHLQNDEELDHLTDGEDGHMVVTDDCKLETVWRDSYAKRRAQYKESLKPIVTDAPPGSTGIPYRNSNTLPAESHMSITSLANAHAQTDSLHRDVHLCTGELTITDKKRIMDEVSLEFSLNEEQDRAFRIVANHSIEPKQCCPLSLFLSGPGGTGKSRVIDSITTFFSRLNETRRFRLASYTGVAAKNIKGMTLHTLLNLRQLDNENGKENNSASKQELFAMWSGVEYLLIDELSMIGCEFLTKISAALSIAKCNPDPFGGVSLIFAGDFCQLPPVKNTRLFSPIEDNNLVSDSQNKWAQMKLMGRSAWLATDTIIVLHQQMRQQGQQNIRFRQLLDRLRFGACNQDDINLLKTRLMSQTQNDLASPEWRSAPIITRKNHVKDVLNFQGAETFAARNRKPIHYYHARDFRKGKPVNAKLQEQLLQYHSGKTSQAMGRLPLVEGMPVMFSQNYDVAGGVVNGSMGILKSVRYSVDENGTRFAESCVIELPDITCDPMEGLKPNEVVALAEEFDVKIKDWRTDETTTFKRRQLPIQPAFAMTDYKAQGRTLKNVILDLRNCVGSQSPYVMVSRATSLEGILILRDFASERVRCHLSQNLRKELGRLDELHIACKNRFSSGEHFCRASLDHPIQSNLLKKMAPQSVIDASTSFQNSNPESQTQASISDHEKPSPISNLPQSQPTNGFALPPSLAQLEVFSATSSRPQVPDGGLTTAVDCPIPHRTPSGLTTRFPSERTNFPLSRSSFTLSTFGRDPERPSDPTSFPTPLHPPQHPVNASLAMQHRTPIGSLPNLQTMSQISPFPHPSFTPDHTLQPTESHTRLLTAEIPGLFRKELGQTTRPPTDISHSVLSASFPSITLDLGSSSPPTSLRRSVSMNNSADEHRPAKRPRLR